MNKLKIWWQAQALRFHFTFAIFLPGMLSNIAVTCLIGLFLISIHWFMGFVFSEF